MLIRALSALVLLAGTVLVLAYVAGVDLLGRMPGLRDLRDLGALLRRDAAYLRRATWRWARARWCHWRQHWRQAPLRHVGAGYRCSRCGVAWPDLVAAGVVEEGHVRMVDVERESRRAEAERRPVNAALARRGKRC